MAKMTRKGREFVSDEISHLMKEGPSKGPQKGKKMPQKQAVAVALDVARRKGLKTPPNPNESYGFGSGTRSSFDFAEGRIARFKLVKAAVYRKYPGLKEAFGSGHHSTEVLPLKKPKFKSLDEKPPYHVTTEVLPKPVEPKRPTNPSSEEYVSIFDNLIQEIAPFKRAAVSYKLAKRGGAPTGAALGHGILGIAGGSEPGQSGSLGHMTSYLRQRRRDAGWNKPQSSSPPSSDPKPPISAPTMVPKRPTNPSSEEMNMSMFDSIIENNRPKSLFDAIVVGGGKSRFDDIVEANKAPAKSMFDDIIESKNGPAAADWDDRVARTLNLTEELVGIRDRART